MPIGDFCILMAVMLQPKHRTTGFTRHYAAGQLLGRPVRLVNGSFRADRGFYLLYLDSEGNELTDTYHESIEAAMEQARLEFGVESSEWQRE